MGQLQSDIVILSAGTAGLAAAVTAAEGGASVISVEKASHTGGTALRANQLFCVESSLQRIRQYSLTKEEAFRIYMDFTQWAVNARLVKSLIDRSTGTMEWLEEMGVEFVDLTCHGPGGHYTAHIIRPNPPRPGLGGAATAHGRTGKEGQRPGSPDTSGDAGEEDTERRRPDRRCSSRKQGRGDGTDPAARR